MPSGAVKQLAAKVSGGEIVVSDSFDRSNSTTSLGTADTGQAWTAANGTWGISSNKAYLVSATGQAVATVNAEIADIEMTCDITLSSTNNRADTGLVLRFIDNNNYLVVVIGKVGNNATDNTFQMFKRDGGTFTQLQAGNSAGNVNGTTYTVRVVADGNVITAYRDNDLSFTHTLTGGNATKFGSPTRCGIRTSVGSGNGDDGGSRHDNFTVETL
jgi:hypothetical protein